MEIRSLGRAHSTARTLSLLLLFALLLGSLAGTIPAQAAPPAQGTVQRIRFAPGATSTVVEGTLYGGQVARYVLGAMAGQTMTLQPSSEGSPVIVTLFDPNRTILGSTASGEQWSGRLPVTGDYTLNVYPSPYAGNTHFSLRIEILFTSQPPNPTTERIRFAPGTSSGQVTGYLPSGASKVYVLGARAGQVMTVESWAVDGPFRFTISGADGTWLGAGNQGESWSGSLPRTQDYRITLQSPAGAPPADYGLRITIVNPAPAPTLVPTPRPTATLTPIPPPPSVRVRFPSGATSVTLTGYVDSFSPARYVLRALQGQTMTVYLTTLYGNTTRVTVRDDEGNFLGAAGGGQQWSGRLPSTGDYYLEVQAPSDNPGDTFSLWVEIK